MGKALSDQVSLWEWHWLEGWGGNRNHIIYTPISTSSPILVGPYKQGRMTVLPNVQDMLHLPFQHSWLHTTHLDDFLQLIVKHQHEGPSHTPENIRPGTLEEGFGPLISGDLPPAVNCTSVHDVSCRYNARNFRITNYHCVKTVVHCQRKSNIPNWHKYMGT